MGLLSFPGLAALDRDPVRTNPISFTIQTARSVGGSAHGYGTSPTKAATDQARESSASPSSPRR